MEPSLNNLCNVIVGGTTFTFSKTSFEQPHMNDTIIKTCALREHNNHVPYFEVDPDLFKRFLAPYIRNGRFPDKQDLTSPSYRNQLVDAANICGLIALAKYVESIEDVKEVKKIRIGYSIQICADPVKLLQVFDNIFSMHYFTRIDCPDKSCGTMFYSTSGPMDPHEILRHLLSSHKGSKKISTQNTWEEKGHIECEMKEYVKLERVDTGKYTSILVYPE